MKGFGFRRKNIYLEELMKNYDIMEKIKGGSPEEIVKIKEKIQQIVNEYNKENQDNGHIFYYPYKSLIVKVSEFTEKWKNQKKIDYECDAIEIIENPINLKIQTEFTKYSPSVITTTK
jgi:phosphorylcholine metabolism protein LicD